MYLLIFLIIIIIILIIIFIYNIIIILTNKEKIITYKKTDKEIEIENKKNNLMNLIFSK